MAICSDLRQHVGDGSVAHRIVRCANVNAEFATSGNYVDRSVRYIEPADCTDQTRLAAAAPFDREDHFAAAAAASRRKGIGTVPA